MDGKTVHTGCTAPIDLCLIRLAQRIQDDANLDHKPVAITDIASGILPALHEHVVRESNIAKNGKLKHEADERFQKEVVLEDEPDKGVTCDACKSQVFNYFWVDLEGSSDYCPKCIDEAACKKKEQGEKARFRLKYVHFTDTDLLQLEKYLGTFIMARPE